VSKETELPISEMEVGHPIMNSYPCTVGTKKKANLLCEDLSNKMVYILFISRLKKNVY